MRSKLLLTASRKERKISFARPSPLAANSKLKEKKKGVLEAAAAAAAAAREKEEGARLEAEEKKRQFQMKNSTLLQPRIQLL